MIGLKRKLPLAIVLAGSCLVTTGALACTNAEAPAEAKSQANPVENGDEVMAAAKKIYKKKCKKCHGSKGNGKGPGAKDMDPMPPDWTSGIKLTDGELHWFIMNGCENTEMKGWKAGSAKPGKEVSDEQAWELVHYIRSLVK